VKTLQQKYSVYRHKKNKKR